jgi:hypothetical protein
MKKDAFCIGCYPSNDTLRNLLKQNLTNLKKSGNFDIFLSTHYDKVDQEILDLVDYYIFDKNNTFLDKEHSPCITRNNEIFNIVIYSGGHGLAGMRNIVNLAGFVESLGYDFFYYSEGDNVFSENDIKKIILTKEKCLFFNKNLFISTNGHALDFILFGAKPKYFRENIKLPITTEEWKDLYWLQKKEYQQENEHFIERIFYLKYKDYTKDFLFIEESIAEYLNESIINGYRHGLLSMKVLHNWGNPSRPVLFVLNLIPDSPPQRVIVKVDDVVEGDFYINYNSWWYKEIEHGDRIVNYTCVDKDGNIEKEVNIKLEKDNVLKLLDLGFIYWKK